MYFSDTVSSNGLVQDIDDMCHTDSTSYPLVRKARNINAWYRKVVSWIRSVHGDWQYDDSNLTTLPVYTCDLVHNQQDYELPSTAQAVERVEVLSKATGDYVLLSLIDKKEIGEAMSEFEGTPGLPQYYDLVGRSILLYPAPSTDYVTATAGLKIYVARDVTSFNATATETEPGFASNFHRILSLGAAFDFEEDPTKKNYLIAQINELKSELVDFYSRRDSEAKTIIEPHRVNYE